RRGVGVWQSRAERGGGPVSPRTSRRCRSSRVFCAAALIVDGLSGRRAHRSIAPAFLRSTFSVSRAVLNEFEQRLEVHEATTAGPALLAQAHRANLPLADELPQITARKAAVGF